MTVTLTSGRPWRVITVFAVPLLIGNVVQQLYQFADAVVVGQHLGVGALASVGATAGLMFLLLGFAWGLGTGFAIPIARAYGAGDRLALQRSVATGTVLVAAMSVLLTVAGPLFAERALTALRTPEELIPGATDFVQVSLLGASVLMFFNYLAAVLRAIGDSRTPLLFLIIACVLNVALVLVLVGLMNLGIAGAALATVAAQAVSVLLCLEHIRRRVPVLHVPRRAWRTTRAEAASHLRLGLPMGFQASIIAIGSLAVQVRLNSLGADAVAAYTSAARVDALAVALLQSLGLAVSMFVAQNSGARRPDRIRQGVLEALIVAAIAAVVVGATVIALGRPLIQLFVGAGSGGIVDTSTMGLTLNGSLYVVLSVLFVLRGALQGLGHTLVPTTSGAMELLMRIITAVVLGGLFGYAGVVWGTPLAWVGAVILLLPAYLRAHKSLATPSDTAVVPGSRGRLGPRASDPDRALLSPSSELTGSVRRPTRGEQSDG